MRRIPRVKFLDRASTNYILIIDIDLKDKSFKTLFREARQKGDFDVDFHFLVHRDGNVEVGRDIDAIGSFNIREDAIIIFVDTLHGKETDWQVDAVTELVDTLKKKYKGAEVQKSVRE